MSEPTTEQKEAVKPEDQAMKMEEGPESNTSVKDTKDAVTANEKEGESNTSVKDTKDAVTANEKEDDQKEAVTEESPKYENQKEEVIERTWDLTGQKVIIKNVLKFMPPKKVKKMADQWLKGMDNKVKFKKVKKPPKDAWICVTLEEESMVPIFINYINNNHITNKKGNKLFAQRVAAGDNMYGDDNDGGRNGHKRGSADDRDSGPNKRQRQENEGPRIIPDEEIKDAMIPLWRKSYQEQLKEKEKDMVRRCAQKIVKETKDKFVQLRREAKRNKNRKAVKEYPWLNEPRSIEILPILPSNSMVRNKCEFTFGYRYIEDENGSSNTVEAATEKKEDSDTAMKTMDPSNTGDAATKDENSNTTTETKLKKIPSLGAMARGWCGSVSHPRCSRNIPSEAVAIVDCMEEYLADCPMPPYEGKIHRGFWRQMTIRSSRRTNECMIIIVHAPTTGGAGSKDNEHVDNYDDVFESEKQRLVTMLTTKDLPVIEAKLEEDNTPEENVSKSTMKVTSIFFQEFDGLSHPGPDHPVQHVFGEKCLKERLGKCTFQISPGAFFQVNTETAETLYNVVVEKVRDVASNPQETLCFDVCCGTGTIGLTLMKEGVVGRIVGVDISAPAIDDAKINAKLNGYDTDGDGKSSATRFVADKAENVLGHELNKAKTSSSDQKWNIVAVVDPAREGLHPDVVKSLRGFPQIQRIVYVSCNPTGSLVKDASLLCSPPTKRYRGRPFKPTFAQPVDMFPYSDHCELVMVFDRTNGDGEDNDDDDDDGKNE